MVATGANNSIKKVGTNVEIIDLIDYSVETFILKDPRGNRFDAIGSLVHDQPVIIGGAYDWGREERATDDGFIIGEHQKLLNDESKNNNQKQHFTNVPRKMISMMLPRTSSEQKLRDREKRKWLNQPSSFTILICVHNLYSVTH